MRWWWAKFIWAAPLIFPALTFLTSPSLSLIVSVSSKFFLKIVVFYNYCIIIIDDEFVNIVYVKNNVVGIVSMYIISKYHFVFMHGCIFRVVRWKMWMLSWEIDCGIEGVIKFHYVFVIMWILRRLKILFIQCFPKVCEK